MKPAALILPLLLAGCATADRAQLADGATTAIGLTNGFAEANPVLSGLSGPAILVVKLGATQAFKVAPKEVCESGLYWSTGLGYSAALFNVGVLAGSGAAALPAIIALWAWRDEAWQADATRNCRVKYPYEWVRESGPDGDVLIARTFPIQLAEYRYEAGFGNR